MRLPVSFALILAGIAVVSTAAANTITVVDFETVPVLAQVPSFFGGPAQTVVVPNVATFSGGTVLGLAANFPAIAFATVPNVYGTTNGVAGYSPTLLITIDPGYSVNEVSFPIFNGENTTESYVATAFDGATQVAQQTFSNVPSNFNSGFVLADLLAANITSVTITTLGSPASFYFIIDTVAFNEPVQHAVAPEPASFALIGLGMAGVLWSRRRKQV